MDILEQIKRDAAFKKLFNISNAEVLKDVDLNEWIKNSLIEIVEYDGTLQNETITSRENRMEIVSVYDDEPEEIVQYLRTMDSEKYGPLTKWEVVFTCHNEISSVEKIAKRAIRKANTIKSENEEHSLFNKEVTQEYGKIENLIGKKSDSRTQKPESEKVGKTTESTTDGQESLISKEEKETIIMSNTSNLADLANKAKAQEMGGTVSTKPAIKAEAINSARNTVEATISERTSWTQGNLVEKVVVPFEPTAMRLGVNPKGVISSAEGTLRVARINKVYENFKAATGYEPDSFVEGQAVSIKDKFPKVADEFDRKKADAVLTIIQQLKNDNNIELPVYVPSTPAYSVKGVVIKGAPLSNSEFQNTLIAKSTGAAYGVGSLDAKGKPSPEATIFILSAVNQKKTVKNAVQGTAPTTGNAVAKESAVGGVIRIKNKAAFLEKPEHIEIVFNTIQNPTAEQKKAVSAKAAIIIDGNTLPASFRYETDEQQKDATGTDVKPKMKTFSLSIRTEVAITNAEPNALFGTAEQASAKFGKGVNAGESKREAIDYTDSEAVRKALAGTKSATGTVNDNAMIKLMAAMASGQSAADPTGEAAEIIKSIKAEASNTAAKENAEAQAEMDDDKL